MIMQLIPPATSSPKSSSGVSFMRGSFLRFSSHSRNACACESVTRESFMDCWEEDKPLADFVLLLIRYEFRS